MASQAFYEDLETAIVLAMKVRDFQRAFDALEADGDITAVQKVNLQNRANRHIIRSREILANLNRDAVVPQPITPAPPG